MKKLSFFLFYLLFVLTLSAAYTAYWAAELTVESAGALFAALVIAMVPFFYRLMRRVAKKRGKKKARHLGIHVKGVPTLLHLAEIDTLAVTKNGVITSGHPYITDLIGEGVGKNSLLSLAASVEKKSTHPIAKAICATAYERGCRLSMPSAVTETPGMGAEALIARTPVRVGKSDWLEDQGVEIRAGLLTSADQIAGSGATPVFVSNGQYCRGIIVMKDDIIEETAPAVRKLKKAGIETVLLTGDTKRVAAALAKETRIDRYSANLAAKDKAREIQLMRAKGKTIALAFSGALPEEVRKEADLTLLLKRPAGMAGSPLGVTVDAPEESAEATAADASAEEVAAEKKAAAQKEEEEKDRYDLVFEQATLRKVYDAVSLAQNLRSVLRRGKIMAIFFGICLTAFAFSLPLLGLTITSFFPLLLLTLQVFAGFLLFYNARQV